MDAKEEIEKTMNNLSSKGVVGKSVCFLDDPRFRIVKLKSDFKKYGF